MTQLFRPTLAALLLLASCAAPLPGPSCAHSGPIPQPRSNVRAHFTTPDGKLIYPPDNGFASPQLHVLVLPGQTLDRFGDTAGQFLSPYGASYASRALPYQCATTQYHAYRVLRPFEAATGSIAPAFGDPGGGLQLVVQGCIQQLIAQGALAEIPASPPTCPASEN